MASASLDWERHKEVMRGLYVDEKKTLKDVMDIMKGPPYNFFATKKQYERQFQKKWSFRKNLTKQDWKVLHFKVAKRQSQGKKTKVFVDGRLQKLDKLEHEISRYGLNKSAVSEFEPTTPEGILLRSPTLSQTPSPTPPSPKPLPVVVPDPGNTHSISGPATTIEPNLISTRSHPNELPYRSLFSLFHFCFQSPRSRSFSENASLAWFPMLPYGAGWTGKDFNLESVIFQQGLSLQAIIPTDADLVVSVTKTLGQTEKPPVSSLTNTAYLVYNSFDVTTLAVSMLQFLGLPENCHATNQLLSSSSIAIEAFIEKLFDHLLYTGNETAAVSLIEQGRVPLHAQHLIKAIRQGSLRIVELLLARGIDPNSTIDRRTALKTALDFKHYDIAKRLLDRGADPTYAFLGVIEMGDADVLGHVLHSPEYRDSNASVEPDHKALRLAMAAGYGNVDMVKALISQVDINSHTPDGFSALVSSALQGNHDIVSFLLRSGASPNRFGAAALKHLGPSPLQAAIRAIELGATDREDLRTIRLLLEKGADPNEPPEERDKSWNFDWADTFVSSRTAIQAAAEIGHEGLFFCLLRHGADPYAAAAKRHGITALQGALKSQSRTLWNFFASAPNNLNPAPTIHAGTTALTEAIRAGNISAVLLFLDSGCDINDTGSLRNGCTALSTAIMTKDMTLVKTLLDAGANINPPQILHDGGTALQAALAIANQELVEHLLAMGANVFDEKALFIAVCQGPLATTTILSAIEAARRDGCTQELKGQTALHAAISLRDLDIILRLLQIGIDPNKPANDFVEERETCLECTYHEPFGSWQWIMNTCHKNYLHPGETALATTIRIQRKDAAESLLEHGAHIEAPSRGKHGRHQVTALGVAAMSGHADMMEWLLSRGADIDAPAKGRFGRTPLQAAAEHGDLEIVQLLLDRGAGINAPPAACGGATALQLAAIKGYLRFALMFLDRGADPNAPAAEIEGRTALEGAAEHGRLDMVQLLLDAGAFIGEPGSTSSERILSLAYRNGHAAVIKLLKKHQAGIYGSRLFHGGSAEEYPFMA